MHDLMRTQIPFYCFRIPLKAFQQRQAMISFLQWDHTVRQERQVWPSYFWLNSPRKDEKTRLFILRLKIIHYFTLLCFSLKYTYKAEKAMAPHSSTLAWKIPWTEEPGRLQSMGSRRVGHDWATSLSLFTFMRWRRKWQPTPVFLPGEFQGRRSLVGCHLWGRTESDTTEAT